MQVSRMSNYFPHYTSSWTTSKKRVDQCESRHRLIVELENRESEMKAGDKVSIKLAAQDTRGWTNTRYSSSRAYIVYFDSGLSSAGGVTSSSYVLCVKTA